MKLNELRDRAHRHAVKKGFWDAAKDLGGKVNPRDAEESIPQWAALVHSEVSEAFEHYRSNAPGWRHYVTPHGKPDGFEIEMADIIIRVLDECGAMNIDIEKRVIEKMEYNESRPYMHGGKRC